MSTTEVHRPAAQPKASPRERAYRTLLLAALGFVAVAVVVQITDQYALTSGGTVGSALILAAPIALAALGGLWSERAGIVNIGLEGMLILGTWFGAYGAWESGSPWVGLIVGMLGGALGGLLHAVATVSFGVDHIVSGVAVTILATGLVRFLSQEFFDTPEARRDGGGPTQSPDLPKFPDLSVPGVKGPLEDLEKEHLFLISDIAGVLRGLLTDLSALTFITILLIVASYYVLWKTPFGLRIRSVGENPQAAESLGVPTYTMRYISVTISGGMAGIGGVFLASVASSAYQENQTGGRGYIGLAAMIFGNWRPGGLAVGSGLFGYTDALQLRGSSKAVHALLLLLALGMFALFLWYVARRVAPGFGPSARPDQPQVAVEGARTWLKPVIALAVGLLLLIWYLTTDEVPSEFTPITPHVTTLLVLALATQRLRPPAWDGKPYRKGDGG